MITVGVDEVGRGCWAGPLVAGAVALTSQINGLTDSKLLTKLARQRLDLAIRSSDAAFGLGWVSAQELDQIGLSASVALAMSRAVAQLTIEFDEIIVDGNINFLPEMAGSRSLIKADQTEPAVSAASILAKVARDTYMTEQAALYPEYSFEQHVGYGTAKHLEALQAHGVTPLHRRSFRPVKAFI